MRIFFAVLTTFLLSSCLYIVYPTEHGDAKMVALFKSAEGVDFKKDADGVHVSVDSTHSVDPYAEANKALDLADRVTGRDTDDQ